MGGIRAKCLATGRLWFEGLSFEARTHRQKSPFRPAPLIDSEAGKDECQGLWGLILARLWLIPPDLDVGSADIRFKVRGNPGWFRVTRRVRGNRGVLYS